MSQTVLITGASGGIGRACALEFARHGLRPVLVARSEEKLRVLRDEIQRESGLEALILPADLCEEGAAQALLEALDAQGVEVDVLVNNAGFGDYAAFLDAEWVKQRRMVELNILALMHLSHLFGRRMRARGHGRILNIASLAAFTPGPYMSVYYASKAFVLSFSEAMAEELKGSGVTVTAFCPGPTRTGFEAAADMENSHLFATIAPARAEDVARACYKSAMRGCVVRLYSPVVKLMAFSTRFAPRALVRKTAKGVNGVPKGGAR